MCTHNPCIKVEIRKIMYTPVNPQFYYIKVGFKGVKIICFRNAVQAQNLNFNS